MPTPGVSGHTFLNGSEPRAAWLQNSSCPPATSTPSEPQAVRSGGRPPGSGGMAGPRGASASSCLPANRKSASPSGVRWSSPDVSWMSLEARSQTPGCSPSRAATRCRPSSTRRPPMQTERSSSEDSVSHHKARQRPDGTGPCRHGQRRPATATEFYAPAPPRGSHSRRDITLDGLSRKRHPRHAGPASATRSS
jgi:hypothetical protein